MYQIQIDIIHLQLNDISVSITRMQQTMDSETMQSQLASLQKELSRLTRLIEIQTDPPSNTVITRGDITPTVSAALIAIMPLQALSGWGITGMFEAMTTKMNDVKDIRVFTGASVGETGNSGAIFCGGPGSIVTAPNEHLEPLWGIAGLYPHLVFAGLPFFNAQLPLNVPQSYMHLVYDGMRRSDKAIIVFYPPPWTSYLEAAMLMFFVASGSTHVYTVMAETFVSDMSLYPDGPAVCNIPGTLHGMYTMRDRRVNVATIVDRLMHEVGNRVPDSVARVYRAIHVTPSSKSLLDDIKRSANRSDRLGAISQMITKDLFNASAPSIAFSVRNGWRTSVGLLGAETDIGVCLHYIYVLRMGKECSDILYVVSQVHALVGMFHAMFSTKLGGADAHLKDMLPVIMLMNMLLPTSLQTVFT